MIPSYCDRILYKTFSNYSILPTKYTPITNINLTTNNKNEHTPLLSVFKFNTNRVYLSIYSTNLNLKPIKINILSITTSGNNNQIVNHPIMYFYSDTFLEKEIKTKTNALQKCINPIWPKNANGEPIVVLLPWPYQEEFLNYQHFSLILRFIFFY